MNGELEHVGGKESSQKNLKTTFDSKELLIDDVKANHSSRESSREESAVVVGNKVTFEVGTQTSDEESQLPSISSTSSSAAGGVCKCDSKATETTTSPNSPTLNSGSINANISCTSGDTTSSANSSSAVGPLVFRSDMMTYDPHCYECKVRYRDPKPKDLVMYLHALTYQVCQTVFTHNYMTFYF